MASINTETETDIPRRIPNSDASNDATNDAMLDTSLRDTITNSTARIPNIDATNDASNESNGKPRFPIYQRNKTKPIQKRKKDRDSSADPSSLLPHYVMHHLNDNSTSDSKITIRSVQPYIHEFKTFIKGRWIGKPLLQIMIHEFGSHPQSYWEDAIKNGNIRINNKVVSPNYCVRNAEQLVHRTHRHEPPIVGNIHFIQETEDLIAVCKPASLPMHPCGAYRHNSLTSILAAEPVIENQPLLRMVHRLDRVTSGLVVLAKTQAAANRVSEEIRNKITRKTYLARVKGTFPGCLTHIARKVDPSVIWALVDELGDTEGDVDGDVEAVSSACESKAQLEPRTACQGEAISSNVDDSNSRAKLATVEDAQPEQKRARIECNSSSMAPNRDCNCSGQISSVSHGGTAVHSVMSAETIGQSDRVYFASVPETGQILLSCPVGVASHRDGIHTCCIGGKTSISAFRSIDYDPISDTTLVESIPITGRTHQLRLHLQFLGSPIANDPCYGGELFYGDRARLEQAVQLLSRMRQLGQHPMSKVPEQLILAVDDFGEQVMSGVGTSTLLSSESVDAVDVGAVDALIDAALKEPFVDPLVQNCRYCQDKNSPELERLLHCDGVWLHALRYEGPTWRFEAPLPPWCSAFDNDKVRLHINRLEGIYVEPGK